MIKLPIEYIHGAAIFHHSITASFAHVCALCRSHYAVRKVEDNPCCNRETTQQWLDQEKPALFEITWQTYLNIPKNEEQTLQKTNSATYSIPSNQLNKKNAISRKASI